MMACDTFTGVMLFRSNLAGILALRSPRGQP